MNGKISNCLTKAQLNENESSVISSEKNFSGEDESARIFSILKSKILSVTQWNKHGLLSTYRLFDENGQELKTDQLVVGIFIRIALKSSGKYDWIEVFDIYEAENEFVITVKPTYNPTENEPDKDIISHFFTQEATNNFCLLRNHKTVTFYVIGLDEKQNTSATENMLETVRNLAVNLGSYLGIQRGEWEKFTHGFLEDAASGEK